MNRVLLFLVGCIGTRLLITYLAKTGSPQMRRWIAYFAAVVSIGFLTIWLFDLRKTGAEAGGEIWWNELRPVHAFMYGMFAVLVLMYSNPDAWMVLLADTLIGLGAWASYRF